MPTLLMTCKDTLSFPLQRLVSCSRLTGFPYILLHLPGHLGEFLALAGARLNGKQLVAAGVATHSAPSMSKVDANSMFGANQKIVNEEIARKKEEYYNNVEIDNFQETRNRKGR